MAHRYIFPRRRRRRAIAGQPGLKTRAVLNEPTITARPVVTAGPAIGLLTRAQVQRMKAEGVIAIKQVINRETGEGGPLILVTAQVSEVT